MTAAERRPIRALRIRLIKVYQVNCVWYSGAITNLTSASDPLTFSFVKKRRRYRYLSITSPNSSDAGAPRGAVRTDPLRDLSARLDELLQRRVLEHQLPLTAVVCEAHCDDAARLDVRDDALSERAVPHRVARLERRDLV
jgi:hypothetical protein